MPSESRLDTKCQGTGHYDVKVLSCQRFFLYFWFGSVGLSGFVISRTPISTRGWMCLFLLTECWDNPILLNISWAVRGIEQKFTISFCAFVNRGFEVFTWCVTWCVTWCATWFATWFASWFASWCTTWSLTWSPTWPPTAGSLLIVITNSWADSRFSKVTLGLSSIALRMPLPAPV